MSASVSSPRPAPPQPTRVRPAKWIRKNRTLLIAFGASLVLHLAATGGIFGWFVARTPVVAAQFEAVLISSKTSAEVPLSLRNDRPNTAPSGRQTTPRRRAPKSEATFAAPENTIAVDRPVNADGADVAGEASAIGGKLAEDAARSERPGTVPAVTEVTPVAIEKPASPETLPAVPATAQVVALPSRVWIAFHATTSVADGVAHYNWKREGTKYSFESTIQATGFFVEMFVGTITQQSTGEVTAAGIEPGMFTIRRGDREPETAEFQRATNEVKLSRGSETRQIPMPANLQDTQSFLFQLAVEAPKLKTAEDRLTISVTNGRGINRYTFKKVGEAVLETRLGAVETVHLARETSEPRDGYEAWLSPKHHYLPVKLRFFLDRFPAELIATNITSKP